MSPRASRGGNLVPIPEAGAAHYNQAATINSCLFLRPSPGLGRATSGPAAGPPRSLPRPPRPVSAPALPPARLLLLLLLLHALARPPPKTRCALRARARSVSLDRCSTAETIAWAIIGRRPDFPISRLTSVFASTGESRPLIHQRSKTRNAFFRCRAGVVSTGVAIGPATHWNLK